MNRCIRFSKFLLLLFVLSLSARLMLAQGGAESFSGAPMAASVDELRRASAAVPVNGDFQAQILLEEGVYRISADGTLSYQHRMIYRVDSAEGVGNWSEISMEWDPWFEKPAQLHARVLQPDGRFVELDQKTVTDAPVKAQDDETFSSEHVRRAPLPGVTPGAIVEQVQVVEEKIPYFAAGNIYRFRFSSGVPSARVRVVVDMPAAMPYKDLLMNLPGLAGQKTEADGRRHVVYEQTGVGPSYNSDIDLQTNAPNTPMLEFATGASWKAVAAGYAALADPQMVPEDTKPILPTTLPSGRMERIGAIVTRLHESVRYTGVEFGASRLTPQRPSAVIERKYGDCKDKATLLVAMLRAEGIAAHVALLSTGAGRDVDAALPGMTMFDHAIVYVDGVGGDKPVWIDATAEFFQPGILPFEDSGRMALVVAPETTGLTRTPEPDTKNSTLVETREFTLAPFGPSHVVETSETHGIVDANYRAEYGGSDARIHANLENYAKQAYYAKNLTKVTHGDAQDLTVPFRLSLDVDGARRGVTAMDEAVVAVFPTIVLDSLPKWFQTPPFVVGPDTSAQTKHEVELAEKARAGSYVYRPFTDERRVKVVAPDGFALRSLPVNKTTQLGLATLTETYASSAPGVVTATLHFDSGPGMLTAEQAVAMRAAVLEFKKREYVGIYFDQVAAKAFAQGQIRKALDTDRALIVAHPAEALDHVRLARLLLEAGIGEGARAEALKATQLDPKSATAFSTYGWTLEHDTLGERFGKGYDRAAAIAAYKQAIALDAEDNDPRFDLGILYEFDARGIRYAADADLPAAIEVYRELIKKNKDKDPGAVAQYQDNLLYALYFSKKFGEVDSMLATLGASTSHAALAIASAAAQHGAAAGVAQADKGNVEAGDRNKNLLTAGSLLSQLRLYPEAAEMLQAGIGGGQDAPQTARQIEMYKSLKPASLLPLPGSDPASPVQRLTVAVMSGTLTREMAEKALARQAYTSDAARERDVEKNLQSSGFLRMLAKKSDMTEPVLLDLIAGNMTYSSTGDDATGHKVVATTLGGNPEHFFVVREDGAYRIVADDGDYEPVGVAALYALEHRNPQQAKALLDWKRDQVHREGQDDALAGPLLPRFWTVGSSKPDADSPAAMRLAAISLLAGSMDAKPYLAELQADRDKATGQRQTDLDLLLANAAMGAEQPAVERAAAMRLLEQEPDSLTALRLAGQAYALEGDPKGWLALLAPRIAKKPTDHDLLSEQARAFELAKDYPAARKAEQAVLDSGKAVGNDYNSYAWLGLFDDHIGEDALKAAQQSTMLSKNSQFADLHTLACIYAAEGRTTEARQVLEQAMQAGNESQPNSAVWYALGLIYEQYGSKTEALEAYRRVEAHELDDHTFIEPSSTYLLAQLRIGALAGQAK